MPQSDQSPHEETNNLVPASEVTGETLIFTQDVLKPESFNPEDHVILVVPDSSDNLGSEEVSENEGAHYITISANGSPVHNGDTIAVDPNQFRDSLKSNFLFITKLLPSKSSTLVPIAARPQSNNAVILTQAERRSPIKEQRIHHQTQKSSGKNPKQPRTVKHNGKYHAAKQEGPEIFGKMFPASFNDVLFNRIREVILLKSEPNTNDDSEIAEKIHCPHCPKPIFTLNNLKEHLYNCHTYVNKRKLPINLSTPVRNRTKRPLYRCADCCVVFVSSERMENHDCQQFPDSPPQEVSNFHDEEDASQEIKSDFSELVVLDSSPSTCSIRLFDGKKSKRESVSSLLKASESTCSVLMSSVKSQASSREEGDEQKSTT